jgi:hypothetical protein
MQVTQQLSVYSRVRGAAGESNYFHQLERFIGDLKVLEDKGAPKE